MLFKALIGLLLATTATAQRNGTNESNCTRSAEDDFGMLEYDDDCVNDTITDDNDNNNSSTCSDWEIFDSPCVDQPCDGNSTCIDLTSNGTICNETAWDEFLMENHNMSYFDAEDAGDGFVCLGFGDGGDDDCDGNSTDCDGDDDDDDGGDGCTGDDCGNPCLDEPCFGNTTCYDLTSNGTNWNESAWADSLMDQLDIVFDWDDENLGDGFYCYGSNGTDCGGNSTDCDDDDDDDDIDLEGDLSPCSEPGVCWEFGNSTECIDLTANGTQWNETDWADNLMDILNITYDEDDEHLGEGYYCFADGDFGESPCDGNNTCGDFENSTCIDLTSNGANWNESDWADALMEELNITLDWEDERLGDGYYCYGGGDEFEGENPCDENVCAETFGNSSVCVDLSSNGTEWDEDSWADSLMEQLNITLDWNDTHLFDGFYCLVDDEEEEYESPCNDNPCGDYHDSTCVDLTQNGTVFDVDIWNEFLSDEYGLEHDNETYGYICLRSIENLCDGNGPCNGTDTCVDLTQNGTTWNQTLWEEFLWEEHAEEDSDHSYGYECVDLRVSPCLEDPCGNATCIDLTQNGTNWNESHWSDYMWDNHDMEDRNETFGYECLLPCDFNPCEELNATCVDLTQNGSVWDPSEWEGWLWDEHDMEDNNETHGYECVFPEDDPEPPCWSDPCGNATCIDLTANGTIWNETFFEEYLWNEHELEYSNETHGYECLLPCDFRPCDHLNATCVDLTANGTVWDPMHWEDWLMDNHDMEDDNDTIGYECVYDDEEEEFRPNPCDEGPCGNATCLDLTANGTMWNETYHEELFWDLFEMEYDNETAGYECMLPCDYRPCDDFNATCVDLTANGTVWNVDHWDDWLGDEYSMEYNQDSHGYECIMDPPCDFGPCDHLNLTCIDLTANGTIWNVTYWENWLLDEYEIEYDNSTYGYECVDNYRPPPCDALPCDGEEGVCIDATANATIWNETYWAEWFWDNYRLEYDNATEGYECYVEPPKPCQSMVCNLFEYCEETFLGDDWVEVDGVWNKYQGECVFNMTSCPDPVGSAESPHPSGRFPIHWKGAKPSFLGKQIFESSDQNRIFRYNLKNTDKALVTDIRKNGYIGFMYFSQKNCGPDFLNAVMDYRVNFRIMDFKDLYEISYRYKRVQGSKTGVVLQFRQHTAIDCKAQTPQCVQKYTDMGTAAHDQFYIEIIGKEGVDFTYKKDWETCHSKVALGAMRQEFGVIDQSTQKPFTEEPQLENPNYNFNSTYNFAQCASYSYTFW